MAKKKAKKRENNCSLENPDCDIKMSEVPSLAALNTKFCNTHMEVISYGITD